MGSSFTIYSDLRAENPELGSLVTNLESVYQAIANIMNTRKGERVNLPLYGASPEDFVFDIIDDLTALEIFSNLVSNIELYEPRVKLDYSRSTVDPNYDADGYNVSLIFTVVGLENQKFEQEYFTFTGTYTL